MRHKIETICLSRKELLQSSEQLPVKNKYIIEKYPFNSFLDDEIVKIEGLFDNNVVGYSYPFKTKLLFNGKIIEAGTGSNYRVEKKYRKYEFGWSIAEKKLSLSNIQVTGMVSPMAKPIDEYLGYKFVDMPNYLLLKSSRKILERHISKFLLNICVPVIDCILRVLFTFNILFVKIKYCRYIIQEKDLSEIDYNRYEELILNDGKIYKEYHNREWLNFVLNYKPINEGYQRYMEVYHKGKIKGFLLFKVRNQGDNGHWRNFVTGTLLEWGGENISEKDLFAMSILAFPEKVDGIELANIDTKVINGNFLIPKIKLGSVNYGVRVNKKEVPKDLFDWSKWRLRVACGDNMI